MSGRGARVPFTPEDQTLLATFLASQPSHKRLAQSIYKEFALRHPHHSWESWHGHYKKAGQEEVDRKIDKIDRAKAKAKAANRQAQVAAVVGTGRAGAGAAAGDNRSQQQNDLQVASGSGNAPPVAGPSSKNKRSRDSSPSSGDDSPSESKRLGAGSSLEPEELVASGQPMKRTRTPFDKKDAKLVVRELVAFERRCDAPRAAGEKAPVKSAVWERLVEKGTDHTTTSWQSFYSTHKLDLDRSIHKELKRMRHEDREARRAARQAAEASAKQKAKAWPVAEAGIVLLDSDSDDSDVILVTQANPSSAAKRRPTKRDEARRRSSSAEAPPPPPRLPNPVFTDDDDSILVELATATITTGGSLQSMWTAAAQLHPHHSYEEWKQRWDKYENLFYDRAFSKGKGRAVDGAEVSNAATADLELEEEEVELEDEEDELENEEEDEGEDQLDSDTDDEVAQFLLLRPRTWGK